MNLRSDVPFGSSFASSGRRFAWMIHAARAAQARYHPKRPRIECMAQSRQLQRGSGDAILAQSRVFALCITTIPLPPSLMVTSPISFLSCLLETAIEPPGITGMGFGELSLAAVSTLGEKVEAIS